MSVYIRKMALNGYVIVPKWPDPDFYIHMERIRQLYTELYKEKKKSDIKMRMLLFLFFEIFDVKCDQVTVNGFLMG